MKKLIGKFDSLSDAKRIACGLLLSATLMFGFGWQFWSHWYDTVSKAGIWYERSGNPTESE